MKPPTTEVLLRQLTPESFDRNLARLLAFLAAILILALSFWKMTRLDLTEAQLFFGLLLSLVVPLLFIVIGLLLPISEPAKHA